ncbi:MAG: hypothetical protein EAZ15_07095 [Sphingobacteriales bacterium]|nr:MAG: hypothetical protein EAZ15_07095 [Sphingobacteriales bacterium]
MLVSQGSEFKLKFGGDQHQIDANTFVASLIHNINILEEINKSIDPNKKIDIKVKAPVRGSVEVEIGIQATNIIDGIKTLFTDENISYTANLITVFGGIYATYRFLGGSKAEKAGKAGKENNITITNSNGNTLSINENVYNIYQNRPIIRESISKNFEAIEKDDSIDSFQIIDTDETKTYVNIPQQEFEILANIIVEVTETEKSEVIKAPLRIVRLAFEGALKSDFYYNGFKISAKIKDEQFIRKIDEGEKFAKGDHLIVDLEITKQYEESVDTFINKSFSVNKVHEHLPRGYQTKIESE